MNFGDKLFKLRKEKGMSQEALADQLGTTRQAVSKWENNQGYPETEKILQLSQLFGVSTDYLLKAEKLERTADEKGYYVSREMVNGFLASEKRVNRFLALGFLCGALTGIPIILFENQPAMRLVGAAGIGALGVSALIVAMFAEQEQYKVLKEEPLLFDPEVRRTLNDEYRTLKKKAMLIAVPSTILFVLGLLALVFSVRGIFPWSSLSGLIFLGLGLGLFGFVISLGTIEAYEILVKNEQYAARFLFKAKRRIRDKIAKL